LYTLKNQHKILVETAQSMGFEIKDFKSSYFQQATDIYFNGITQRIGDGTPMSLINVESVNFFETPNLLKLGLQQIELEALLSNRDFIDVLHIQVLGEKFYASKNNLHPNYTYLIEKIKKRFDSDYFSLHLNITDSSKDPLTTAQLNTINAYPNWHRHPYLKDFPYTLLKYLFKDEDNTTITKAL